MNRPNRVFRKNIFYSLSLFGTGAIFGGLVTLFGFITVTGGTAEPSQPLSAPTLAIEAVPILESPVSDSSPATQGEELPTPVAEVVIGSTIEPTTEPTITPEAELASRLYRIDSSRSQARFSVYETFPEGTAIGRTDQIAGDIIIDFNTPVNSQIGTIRINLRSLKTDDPKRDVSIRCCVLLTSQDAYEFGEFVPTSITGLPDQVELKKIYNFTVTGNLTIRGTTQPTTFDVEVIVGSLDRLLGSAETVVNRSDFNILNNSDNGFDYHGVEEQIDLEFTFEANAVTE
jgi:polyisoprenoid-binding protein YceI